MTATILMPVKGPISDIGTATDDAFRMGLLGPGFVIQPAERHFISPADGVITVMFPTHHLVMIRTTHGLDLMIHIGVGDHAVRGDALETTFKIHDSVTMGQTLITYTGQEIPNHPGALTVYLVFPEKKKVIITGKNNGLFDIDIT